MSSLATAFGTLPKALFQPNREAVAVVIELAAALAITGDDARRSVIRVLEEHDAARGMDPRDRVCRHRVGLELLFRFFLHLTPMVLDRWDDSARLLSRTSRRAGEGTLYPAKA
jgi:hypothetical protein